MTRFKTKRASSFEIGLKESISDLAEELCSVRLSFQVEFQLFKGSH